MDIPTTQRLSFKLACLAVLITILLGSLLSLVQITLDYVSESASINQEAQALLFVTQQPASRIAYNIDYELAQELCTGLLSSPGVIDATLTDNFGKQLANTTRPAASSQYRALSDFLFGERRHYVQALRIGGKHMGDLEITLDTFAYGQNFIRRAAVSFVTGFAHALAMSFILLVLFYWQLTNPLKRIISAIRNQSPQEKFEQALKCPKGHEQDELGILVDVTNQHLESLASQIKQRQQAETELTHHLSDLENIVKARTAELTASNLRLSSSNLALDQARNAALQTAQARTTFLANMSHEIRTPLNGLLGMLDLARDGHLSAEQRQQLNLAYESGKMLMALLNDALDLSKFEAGQLQIENIMFDPAQLAEETCKLLSQNAKAAVEFHCFISQEVPELVEGDPTRFKQILINLLSNALKFTEQGGVELLLDYQNPHLTICIRDTGIGIALSQQQRIFEPFAQASIGISRQYGGTGLGLALTLRLCEAMGGTLQLTSSEGLGSEFVVTLPINTQHPAPSWPVLNKQAAYLGHPKSPLARWLRANLSLFTVNLQFIDTLEQVRSSEADLIICHDPALIASVKQQQCPPLLLLARHEQLLSDSHALTHFEQLATPASRIELLQSLQRLLHISTQEHCPEQLHNIVTTDKLAKILLIEDNSINQLVAQGMLNKLGYQVSLASNGLEGLEQLKQQDFDLVLMDCNMPVMDGYEACQMIRRNPKWQNLPVIALTANAFTQERERCQQAGMNDHLAKPFRKEQLIELLQKWLK